MSESVRFDRAADEYDRTRAISDEAMAQTIELLATELGGRDRVLEVASAPDCSRSRSTGRGSRSPAST